MDAGEAQGERGIRLQGIVSGPCAGHSMLLLTWQLPWTLERVLWIGASRIPRLHVRPCLCPRAHTHTRAHAHTRTRAHAHTRTRRHRAMRCRRPGLHGEPATTDVQPGLSVMSQGCSRARPPAPCRASRSTGHAPPSSSPRSSRWCQRPPERGWRPTMLEPGETADGALLCIATCSNAQMLKCSPIRKAPAKSRST